VLLPAGRLRMYSCVIIEDFFGRRVRDERRALWEGGVATGVVAVVGTHDDVSNWLRRGLLDPVDHLLCLGNVALTIGDEDAVVADDDEAHRGHLPAGVA